jgi:hypothetical protein
MGWGVGWTRRWALAGHWPAASGRGRESLDSVTFDIEVVLLRSFNN